MTSWLRCCITAYAVFMACCCATSGATSWHHTTHSRRTRCLPLLQALSLPSGSLSNPHRLDTGTEGLLVLARSSSFARYFSLLLQHKGHEVRKLYRCATTQPPPLGRHVHYVSIGQRRAGEPAHTVVHSSQTEGSSECVLEVLKVSEG